jgi:hypothetical protein
MTRRSILTAACFVALIFAPLAPAGVASAQTPERAEPLKPGAFRLKVRPPEPGKWTVQRDGKTTRTLYTCKPLACPDAALRVTVFAARSPMRTPDPEDLERLATIDLPKAAHTSSAAREISPDGVEKIETVVSETAKYHGYPAVNNLTKYSKADAVVFKATALIFAGPAMIRVEATSTVESLVKETMAGFIAGMQFEEGPAAPKKPTGITI